MRVASGRSAARSSSPAEGPVEHDTSSTSEAAAPLRSIAGLRIAHLSAGTLATTLPGFGVVGLSTLVH
ncbi:MULTISPECIES: hypothetical protein [unclassified Rathayibacter]|uniref:hypothetical protein n=1 Tax=unclassified Rathayibacter TaxID=2609250 RepID=UPI000CE760F9|nr:MULTISPECIES: hypothetical protein [unclassified Rathayibacter]PPI42175.1 hypothetical protein C5D50_00860 [Rathayibacter sp. RFBD1]PPI63909.1 hypothetical protein C5D38_00860 [Rathayibacter sp. TRS19]